MPSKKTTLSIASTLRIGQAAKLLGVSTMTLRRWDATGIFKAKPMGKRGDRRYTKIQMLDVLRNGIPQENK